MLSCFDQCRALAPGSTTWGPVADCNCILPFHRLLFGAVCGLFAMPSHNDCNDLLDRAPVYEGSTQVSGVCLNSLVLPCVSQDTAT